MPTRLSTYNRRRIVTLQQQGKTTSQIVARLREEGVTTTSKTVRKWLHRWNSNLGLEDNFRTGRNSKITMGIASFIEEQLVRDDEISSRELTYLISKRFGMKISSSTLRTFMRTKLQWTDVKTRHGPMISEANKEKRTLFARECLDKGDTFDDVIWTDESTVQLICQEHASKSRQRENPQASSKACSKSSRLGWYFNEGSHQNLRL